LLLESQITIGNVKHKKNRALTFPQSSSHLHGACRISRIRCDVAMPTRGSPFLQILSEPR